MRFVRVGQPGREQPVLIDEHGNYRNVNALIDDLGGADLSDEALAMMLSHDSSLLPVADTISPRGPCIDHGNYWQVGLNTTAELAQNRLTAPDSPVLINLAQLTTRGVDHPTTAAELGDARLSDLGIELGVVLGSRAHAVSAEEARTCIAGYCQLTTISRRRYDADLQGKVIVGAATNTQVFVGPEFATWDEGSSLLSGDVRLDFNGKPLQQSPIRSLLFDPATLIHHLSHQVELEPGDLIACGRPVLLDGWRRTTRRLKPGDVLTASIAGLTPAVIELL